MNTDRRRNAVNTTTGQPLAKQERQEQSPLQQLPALLQVAIDGQSSITRRLVGGCLAQSLGAVLVDTERFYRSFMKSCLESGVALADAVGVEEHCGHARLDVWVRRGTDPFDEASVFVNGDLFTKEELASIPADKLENFCSKQAWTQVCDVVYQLAETARIVVLGKDITCSVLPETPFKFFVEMPPAMLDIGNGELQPAPRTLGRYRYYSSGFFGDPDQYLDVLYVPMNSLSLERVRPRILAELVNQYKRHQEGLPR